MNLFDTHCHLTFPDLLSRADAVIADAKASGVGRMLTVACTPAEAQIALDLRVGWAAKSGDDRGWHSAPFSCYPFTAPAVRPAIM